MRNPIIGLVLAIAACSKPAEKKQEPAAPPAKPAAVAPPAEPVAPPAPTVSAEEKAKAVAVLEEKMKVVTAETSRLAEELTRAASDVERQQIKAKLEQRATERAALAQELEAARK